MLNKATLLLAVKDKIATKAENLRNLIRQTSESNTETKSSMGDKYETTREMIAQEIRNLGRQLTEVENQAQSLAKLGGHPSAAPELGALVQTAAALFYISAPVGELRVEDKKVITVSPDAPLVKAMQGKRSGDTFTLNSMSHTIVEIY